MGEPSARTSGQRLIDLNVKGGIGGYRLELVSLDDEGDARIAAERAQELIVDPLVVAALGPRADGLAGAARQIRWLPLPYRP